jgi:uncharacterized protein
VTDPTYTKPLPRTDDPVTAPFWAALREHRLVMPRCEQCGFVRWPPAALCPECLSPRASWAELEVVGDLWSYVVYHRAFHPGFEADLPYAVGRVVLDAGPSLTARVDAPLGQLSVGARVSGIFEDVTPEVTLLRWVLAEGRT